MDTQATIQSGSPGTLNVMLHGTFSFVFDCQAKEIQAYVPDLAHHVSRAGSWLAETDMAGGGFEYELTGVETGDGSFDPRRNLIVKIQKAPYKPQVRATLKLPRPKQIASLRVVEVPQDSFDHPESLKLDSAIQHMSNLQVFSYDIQDENQLFLKANEGGGHYWEPVFNGKFINLHIFSAEDHYQEPSHAIADFQKCAEILGVNLSLKPTLRPNGIPNDAHLPAGVVAEETEDLALRNLRMARLGRLVSRGGNANLAWYGNDALDSDPSACGGPVGLLG